MVRHSQRRPRLAAAVLGCALATIVGLPAHAHHDVVRRLSVGVINDNGRHEPWFRDASADGTHVVFMSRHQLVSADTDSTWDVYERFGGTTRLVSAGAINGNGPYDATFRRISNDGSRIIFVTHERLVPGDTDVRQDIYQRSAGTTTRLSTGNGAHHAEFAGMSADADRVFWETGENLVAADTDGVRDVYVRQGAGTTLVSVGGNRPLVADFVGASEDGTRAFFVTQEPLVAADTDKSVDIYMRYDGTTKRISAGQINGNGAHDTLFISASADGTRVFFLTTERLVGGDTDSQYDLYERSAKVTTRVSRGTINGNGLYDPEFVGMSADGSRVFFQTHERLTGDDTDSAQDVYERSAGTTTRVSVGEINGNGPYDAFYGGATPDGANVFFETDERLLSTDTDSHQDVYQRWTSKTVRISRGAINGNGAYDAEFEATSANAARVFFSSYEQLHPDDWNTSTSDIHERSAGATTLMAPVGIYSDHLVWASADGSRVIFETQDEVTPDDMDGIARDIYESLIGP